MMEPLLEQACRLRGTRVKTRGRTNPEEETGYPRLGTEAMTRRKQSNQMAGLPSGELFPSTFSQFLLTIQVHFTEPSLLTKLKNWSKSETFHASAKENIQITKTHKTTHNP